MVDLMKRDVVTIVLWWLSLVAITACPVFVMIDLDHWQ